MGLFNIDWFGSQARKELKLKVKENLELTEKAEALVKKFSEPQHESLKIYRSLKSSDGNITVILKNGEVLSKSGIDVNFVNSVNSCYTEDQILQLFIPARLVNPNSSAEIASAEERQIVKDNLDILRENDDFKIEGENVFIEGVSLAIPAIIVTSFIEILERLKLSNTLSLGENQDLNDQYEALKMFWYWLALNPIESSRNDAIHFIRKNQVNITSNGLLEMYRKVVNVGAKDKDLVNFISNSYFKIKTWKKGPGNYWIWKNTDGTMKLLDYKPKKHSKKGNRLGNLAELYKNLPSMSENIFTDSHTKTKIIKLGEIYKEDEEKIDLNNTVSCGAGLHCGGPSFGFDGFGDTGVMCLVNPSKIRSVPNHESNKMRVSEMFVASVLDINDYKKHLDSGNINDFSQEYFNISVEELEKDLANKSFENMVCQDNVPDVTIMDIQEIKNLLKQRVVLI